MPIPQVDHDPIPARPEINVAEEVAFAVDSLAIIGMRISTRNIKNRRSVLTDEFEALKALGMPGEVVVQPPLSRKVSLKRVVAAIDSYEYDGQTYPDTEVWKKAWTPEGHDRAYSLDDLNRLGRPDGDPVQWNAHARFVLHNPKSPDPLRHFSGLPYNDSGLRYDYSGLMRHDDFSSALRLGQATAENALAAEQTAFHAESPDFDLASLNIATICMLVLKRRIKGEPMPVSDGGFIYFPQLGRINLGGEWDKAIGAVMSATDGQLQLGGALKWGGALENGGIGLSIAKSDEVSVV
jgi:hypothetical protein